MDTFEQTYFKTRESLIEAGFNAALDNFRDIYDGQYEISSEDIDTSLERLKLAWNQIPEQEIPEVFIEVISNLVITRQFVHLLNGNSLWDVGETALKIRTIWEIIREWLFPDLPRQ